MLYCCGVVRAGDRAARLHRFTGEKVFGCCSWCMFSKMFLLALRELLYVVRPFWSLYIIPKIFSDTALSICSVARIFSTLCMVPHMIFCCLRLIFWSLYVGPKTGYGRFSGVSGSVSRSSPRPMAIDYFAK